MLLRLTIIRRKNIWGYFWKLKKWRKRLLNIDWLNRNPINKFPNKISVKKYAIGERCTVLRRVRIGSTLIIRIEEKLEKSMLFRQSESTKNTLSDVRRDLALCIPWNQKQKWGSIYLRLVLGKPLRWPYTARVKKAYHGRLGKYMQ